MNTDNVCTLFIGKSAVNLGMTKCFPLVIAGDWVVRVGLPILWLILNDIYKPAPMMFRCVTTEIHFSCFPKFCRRLTHPTG